MQLLHAQIVLVYAKLSIQNSLKPLSLYKHQKIAHHQVAQEIAPFYLVMTHMLLEVDMIEIRITQFGVIIIITICRWF